MSNYVTTQGIDATRTKYRGEIIPASALAVIDAEIEVLRASGLEDRALNPGLLAPDFMLPDPKGRLQNPIGPCRRGLLSTVGSRRCRRKIKQTGGIRMLKSGSVT